MQCRNDLSSKIESGVTVVLDRYVYYTMANAIGHKDLELDWCRGVNAGMPEPDAVFLLTSHDCAICDKIKFSDRRILYGYNALYEEVMWQVGFFCCII